MSGTLHEIEIKLPAADAAGARRLLRRAGFRVSRRRVFEANTLYDTPDQALRAAGQILRVREAGRVATATYKGPATVGRHKSREELEFGITSAPAMAMTLERLGYRPLFRYEKYRTEFALPGTAGVATVDETPVGVYIELEGQPRWIDRMARKLGFSERDYITDSYGRLYQLWCERQGVEAGQMVFEKRQPLPHGERLCYSGNGAATMRERSDGVELPPGVVRAAGSAQKADRLKSVPPQTGSNSQPKPGRSFGRT